MKKLVTIFAVAMLMTLAGCKDATADISKNDEALITVEGNKITKEDIYQAAKKTAGASSTLQLVQEKIADKEGIKVDEAMKKDAEESVKSLKSMYGKDLEKTLQQFGYKDLEDYKNKSVYPGLKVTALTKKYVTEKKTSLFDTYYPVKASIMEVESKKKGETALKALKDGDSMTAVAKKHGVTTTYSGKEELYNSKSGLPTAVFDKIKATKKDGLISEVIEDSTTKKFFIVEINNADATKFEDAAIESIVQNGSTELQNAALTHYLKKYNFTIYDKDVYDGIKSQNEGFIVQD